MRLHREWKKIGKRAWSVRVAGFWGAFGAVIILLPQVADRLPLWIYGPLFIAMSATFAGARFLKQPGIEE